MARKYDPLKYIPSASVLRESLAQLEEEARGSASCCAPLSKSKRRKADAVRLPSGRRQPDETRPRRHCRVGAIIREAVKAVLDELRADDAKIGSNDRIGFTEVEAAGLLGIQPYVLGDARRRGEIKATRVGKKFIYSRTALVRVSGPEAIKMRHSRACEANDWPQERTAMPSISKKEKRGKSTSAKAPPTLAERLRERLAEAQDREAESNRWQRRGSGWALEIGSDSFFLPDAGSEASGATASIRIGVGENFLELRCGDGGRRGGN